MRELLRTSRGMELKGGRERMEGGRNEEDRKWGGMESEEMEGKEGKREEGRVRESREAWRVNKGREKERERER
jgi:hypothetical protein